MTNTRVVAEKLVRHIQAETGELRPDMWANIATDSIEFALRQREQEVRAEERERIAQMLGNGSDGVGGDWEASEAAVAVRERTHEN